MNEAGETHIPSRYILYILLRREERFNKNTSSTRFFLCECKYNDFGLVKNTVCLSGENSRRLAAVPAKFLSRAVYFGSGTN